MNAQLKELIDCMEAGLKKVPVSIKAWTFCSGPYYAPQALCPLGHAILGKFGRLGYGYRAFPILLQQIISNIPVNVNWELQEKSSLEEKSNLGFAIETLSGSYKWSTEQVIEWLKSHLNDLT